MSRDFNSMDDIFNQLMGGMRGYSSENRRYLINGREVTPEEFAHYRATGQLPVEEIQQNSGKEGKKLPKQDGILAKLGRNLTQDARDGKLDPVIGRNKEIQETAEILSRRTKNNPVLVGDAGVGKTAVVEGLAQAIVNGDVPAAIKNKEIISIDISGLEAGTQYRGSFEENIQNLVTEVKELGNVILFFDEIHRFNKLQQDSLLQDLENGNIILIGATTENPYYSLNNALLSRCLAFEFKKLNEEDLFKILKNINEKEKFDFSEEILTYIAEIIEGDARQAINILELLSNTGVNFTIEEVKEVLNTKKSYHKTEDKYDTISAMIKSIRGSDPDAAVYWIGKMLSGGEDPMYLARRLVILSSEDIGLANPQALPIAVAGMHATKEIGMPEARIILSEVAIYLALSPKSNSAYLAIDAAISQIENDKIQEVPKHLTKLGAKDYKYPHAYPENFVRQDYMNKKIKFYNPGDNKFENAANERQEKLWNKKKEK